MTKGYHIHVSIRGALKERGCNLTKMFTDENGRRATVNEIKEYLHQCLAEGIEVLPIGKPCEGFNHKTGCPGHLKNVVEVVNG